MTDYQTEPFLSIEFIRSQDVASPPSVLSLHWEDVWELSQILSQFPAHSVSSEELPGGKPKYKDITVTNQFTDPVFLSSVAYSANLFSVTQSHRKVLCCFKKSGVHGRHQGVQKIEDHKSMKGSAEWKQMTQQQR